MPAYPPAGGLYPIIAETVIDAASQTNKDSTSTSLADFDALATITFTVPSSGIVLVEMEAQTNGDAIQMDWGLWDTSDIAASLVTARYSTIQVIKRSTYAKKISGLTPGASVTYKWRMKRTSGSNLCRMSYGAAAGAAIMRVRSLPLP